MIKPRRVPTDVAALALGVAEATIRSLVHRGQLRRYGTRSRALYDVDELMALDEQRRPDAETPDGEST